MFDLGLTWFKCYSKCVCLHGCQLFSEILSLIVAHTRVCDTEEFMYNTVLLVSEGICCKLQYSLVTYGSMLLNEGASPLDKISP